MKNRSLGAHGKMAKWLEAHGKMAGGARQNGWRRTTKWLEAHDKTPRGTFPHKLSE